MRRVAVVAAAGHRRRALRLGTAWGQMGRPPGARAVGLSTPPPAGRYQHVVGFAVRGRDTNDRRPTGDDPARTALDLTCRYPVDRAVAAIDALARATDLKVSEVGSLGERYRGRRGIARARVALPLVDKGAESPRETWLRLLLIRAGFPRPQTQIPVYDYGALIACLDMGWQDIKLAVEYEGDHHRADQRQFNKDIRRAETLAEIGWTVVRVTIEDTPGGVIARVAAAWARRT